MEASSKQFRKRNAILSCLQRSKSHPSAEALYQDLRQEHPDISLATVYRNLALFRNQGIIRSLGTVCGAERKCFTTRKTRILCRLRRRSCKKSIRKSTKNTADGNMLRFRATFI